MSRTQRGCVGSIHTFAWLLPSVPLLDRSLGAAHPNHPKSLPRIPLTDIPALSTLPAQDLLDECPSFASLLQNSAPFLCFLALPTPQRCRTEIFPLPLLKMTPFPSYLCELEGAVTKKGTRRTHLLTPPPFNWDVQGHQRFSFWSSRPGKPPLGIFPATATPPRQTTRCHLSFWAATGGIRDRKCHRAQTFPSSLPQGRNSESCCSSLGGDQPQISAGGICSELVLLQLCPFHVAFGSAGLCISVAFRGVFLRVRTFRGGCASSGQEEGREKLRNERENGRVGFPAAVI